MENIAKAKAAQKPKEAPEVIVISSDDESEEEEKQYVAKGNKARDKDAKAFSSVLSARSKVVPFVPFFSFTWGCPFHCCLRSNNTICQPQAACGLPMELVVNIDATDTDNELAAAEYIDDIYEFYRSSEVNVVFFFFISLPICSHVL